MTEHRLPERLVRWLLLLTMSLAAMTVEAIEQLEAEAERDLETALQLAVEQLEAAELAGNQRRVAELELFRGRLSMRQDRPALARQAFERAVQVLATLPAPELSMQAYQGLSNALTSQEEYDQALAAAQSAFRLAEQLERVQTQAELYSLIGRIYFFTGDLDAAEVAFARSMELYLALDDRSQLGHAYNNLAVMARHRGEIEQARDLNRRALAIRESLGDISGMAASYNNLAVLAWMDGDLAETERLHRVSLELNRQANDVLGQARSMLNLGHTYLLMERYDESDEYLASSLVLADQLDSNQLRIGNYERRAELEQARGDYPAALAAKTRQLEVTEALRSESRQRQVAELHALFETERREREIEVLQRERESQALIRNALLAGALGLILILFLLWNRFLLKSRANREIAARNDELRAMDRIVATLNTENDFASLLGTILEEALGFFRGADRGAFMVRASADSHYTLAVWKGYRYQQLNSLALSDAQAKERYVDSAERLAEGIYLNRQPSAIQGHEGLQSEDPSQAMLSMAITVDGDTAGYLILQSRRHKDAFTTADNSNYQRFREHAISAFRRARQMDQLAQAKERAELAQAEMARLARSDSLTGLPNRRHMQEKLDEENVRSKRSGRLPSLVICDIDHFKSINDSLGHEAGDEILKHVAGLLRSRLRAQDVIARWGGEEFLLLLPETDLQGAIFVAESLREQLASTPADYGGDRISVTMTFGVAEHSPRDESIQATLRRADQALYEGKGAGRNRVIEATAVIG